MAQDVKLPHDVIGLVPYDWSSESVAIMVLLGLLAAALLTWLWWRWCRGRTAESAGMNLNQDWGQRLRLLEPAKPFDRGAQKEFFYELSWLLRACIEKETAVKATDLTSYELGPVLTGAGVLPSSTCAAVLAFLSEADLIKFADRAATLDAAASAKQSVVAWVGELQRGRANGSTDRGEGT